MFYVIKIYMTLSIFTAYNLGHKERTRVKSLCRFNVCGCKLQD